MLVVWSLPEWLFARRGRAGPEIGLNASGIVTDPSRYDEPKGIGGAAGAAYRTRFRHCCWNPLLRQPVVRIWASGSVYPEKL
jgi:hypothetical protein